MIAPRTVRTSTIVDTWPEAVAFATVEIERHRFTQPQASVMPWLLPPDAAHPEPWPGYRVVVAGRVDVAEPQAPLTAPWPPPTVVEAWRSWSSAHWKWPLCAVHAYHWWSSATGHPLRKAADA